MYKRVFCSVHFFSQDGRGHWQKMWLGVCCGAGDVQGTLCPFLAAVVDDGHVSDISAMIAVHQEEGGGGEAEFRWSTRSPAHPSPPSVDNFPSIIRSSCDAAVCHFRCWCLWHLSGCKTGPRPRPRVWFLLCRWAVEPAAGWTPAETLSVPDMPASSPASTKSTLSERHHTANIKSNQWLFPHLNTALGECVSAYRVTANDLWQEVSEVLGGQGGILALQVETLNSCYHAARRHHGWRTGDEVDIWGNGTSVCYRHGRHKISTAQLDSDYKTTYLHSSEWMNE